MGRRRRPPSQAWRTFLTNHVHQIVAADFFVVPTATCRLFFVLVILAHDRRRVVHTAVTAHPTAAWTAQQFREAFPLDQVPRYLVRDRDRAFQTLKATAEAMGIEEVLTAPRSPFEERVRRALHRLRSPRVSRSRHRVQRRRSPKDPDIVRWLLHDVA